MQNPWQHRFNLAASHTHKLQACCRPRYYPALIFLLINPTMAQVFYKAGFIENWGRGTIKIRELCEKQGLPTPKFSLDCASLIVTFFKSTQEGTQEGTQESTQENLTINAKKIIHEMNHNPKITIAELAKISGLSTSAVQKNLNQLRKKNFVTREGSTKSGHWEVLTKSED